MHVEAPSRPLILAIEADRHRASQLHAALRTTVRADIVVAGSAQSGIDTLAGRVPEVILTSPFLSPKDDSTIALWLRGLGPQAAHVQTLAAPLLAESADVHRNGVLSSLKRDRTSASPQEGCDPAVFAEQVSAYLGRTPAPRVQEPPAPAVREPEVPPFQAAPERRWDRMERDQPHLQTLLEQLNGFIGSSSCLSSS